MEAEIYWENDIGSWNLLIKRPEDHFRKCAFWESASGCYSWETFPDLYKVHSRIPEDAL